jgi:hypothetical protein
MRALVVLLLMLAACSTTKEPSGTTTDPQASSKRSKCSAFAVLCSQLPCDGCSIECPEGKAAVCDPGYCAVDPSGRQLCAEDASCRCQ